MGACSSTDAIAKTPATRDLSNWKADDEHDSSSGNCTTARVPNAYSSERTAATDQVHVNVATSDLALNCVAYHSSFADTKTCVTGWEDGAIRKLHWGNRSDNSDAAAAVVDVWTPHTRAVNRVLVGTSAELLYSCSRDTTVALTSHLTPSASTAKKPQSVLLRGHNLNVATIAVDDTESSLCSGGRDTQTIFWDLRTGALVAKNTTPQNVVTCSKWLPSEPLVVQGSEDLTLKVWDARTTLRTPAQRFDGYVYFALGVDVSPDAAYIVTSSKGFSGVGCEVRVWDRRSTKQLHTFTGHQQDATACCFLPATNNSSSSATSDSQDSSSALPTPVSASKDGSVKVWDPATSSLRCEALAPSAAMFTSLCAVDSTTVLASTFSGAVHAFALDASSSSLACIDSCDL